MQQIGDHLKGSVSRELSRLSKEGFCVTWLVQDHCHAIWAVPDYDVVSKSITKDWVIKRRWMACNHQKRVRIALQD